MSEELNSLFKDLSKRFPNVVVLTAVQPQREANIDVWGVSKLNLGGSTYDVVVVDHINLIKDLD